MSFDWLTKHFTNPKDTMNSSPYTGPSMPMRSAYPLRGSVVMPEVALPDGFTPPSAALVPVTPVPSAQDLKTEPAVDVTAIQP
jgi:hypothetical protein